MPIETTVHTVGSTVVLRASGDLDLATEATLRSAGTTALADGALDVVLDLTQIMFIDCYGLRALIALRDQARSTQRKLRIVGVGGQPLKVLRLTGLFSLLD